MGPGFRCATQCIAPGRRAVAESGELREDVPHPVRALRTGAQLCQHVGIDAILGCHEARQVEGIIHGERLFVGHSIIGTEAVLGQGSAVHRVRRGRHRGFPGVPDGAPFG